MVNTVILEEQKFTTILTDFGYAMEMQASIELVVGQIYTIRFDGIDYLCAGLDTSGITAGTVSVGNGTAIGLSGNGEPFAVMDHPGLTEITVFCWTDTAPTEHTISIYADEDSPDAPGEDEEIAILPERTLGFSEQINGSLVSRIDNSPAIVAGEQYCVSWDGVEHIHIAYAIHDIVDVVVIGPDNHDPFTIMYFMDDTDEYPAGTMLLLTKDTDATHTVSIYTSHEVGIILRDYTGEEISHYGIERLQVNTTDGGTKDFVASDLIPESVEKSVTQEELNFANGAITLTPENGQVFSGVNIPVPENLKPENIAEGVDIAGIIGNFVGGSDVKFACGIVNGTSAKQTITHNLGVIPDIVVFYIVGSFSQNTSGVKAICTYTGLSTNAQTAIGTSGYGRQAATVLNANSTSVNTIYQNKGIESTGGIVSNANETTFDVGSAAGYLKTSIPYNWYAIGGLT